jgi:uncharacterized damage-inducible protein DinB
VPERPPIHDESEESLDTFTTPVEQLPPPSVAPEREALAGWLDFHRTGLLAKLEGLTAEQADRRVVPSLNTLHGLVRHLTKVEFLWFAGLIAGLDEPAPFGWPERRDGDYALDDGASLEDDVARYLAACERSREIFGGVGLDEVRAHGRLGEIDVRWVMIHMIEEYAQHNGQADILRELIDGTTGL